MALRREMLPLTCAQARLVGRTLFSHALHKYGVHGLHSTLLKAWIRKLNAKMIPSSINLGIFLGVGSV